MVQLKTFLLIFGTLYASVLVNGHLHPPVKSFQKKVAIDNSTNDLIYALSKDSGSFNYAACNSTNNSSVCRVTKEIPVTDEVVIKKSCNVNVSNTSSGYTKLLVPLNDETTLLIAYEPVSNLTGTVKIYITRLTNCRVVELIFSNLTRFGQVYANERVFDVFYSKELQNGSKVDCQGHICRETYSLDGRKVHGPEEHLRKPDSGSNVTFEFWVPLLIDYSKRPVAIQYVVSSNQNDTSATQRLYRVSRGVGTELFNSTVTSDKDLITVDNANEKLSFCQNSNGSVACRQYDSDARLRLNLNFNLTDYTSVASENVLLQPYNLRHHGLLVLIIETSLVEENRVRVEDLKVLGVSKSGRYTLPLEIPYGKKNFTCSKRSLITLPAVLPFANVVEDGPEVCLQFLCPDSQAVEYSTVCLTRGHLDRILD